MNTLMNGFRLIGLVRFVGCGATHGLRLNHQPSDSTHFLRKKEKSDPSYADRRRMNKLCTFGGALIGSYVGWYLGSRFGIGWAFFVSGIGSLLGVYLGWKIAQRYS